MFGKLKDKLKGVLGNFSKKVEEEAETVAEEVQEEAEQLEEQVFEEQKEKVEELEKEEEKLLEKEKEIIEEEKEIKEEISEKEDELDEIEKEFTEESQVEEKVEEPKIVEKEIKEAAAEERIEELEAEKAAIEEDIQEIEEEKKEIEEQGFLKKVFSKKKKDEEIVKTKTFGQKVKEALTKKLSEEKFEELFWDIEVVLLENNVSVEVIEKIKADMKKDMVGNPIPKNDILPTIMNSIKGSISELFDVEKIDLNKNLASKKPYVISFIGVNGSGKTTQLAKLASKLKSEGKSVVMAACDTFRAAAIQQLEEHANNLDIKMIKHDYGADAASVAFDAIEHAKAKDIDVVLIDTAGRLHSNENLMKELDKLMRVSNPDLNIFVGESITGNDVIEQAQQFGEMVRIDGIILTKADVDEKGGAAISISYVTGKPIMFLGTGQSYGDLEEFNSQVVLDSLDL